MRTLKDGQLDAIAQWCAALFGEFSLLSDHTRDHPGQRTRALRLSTPAGPCYIKMHRDPAHWENEVHAYEQWAPAFGDFAPRLLAVRDEEPLALIISQLPGTPLEGRQLSTQQERVVWRAAGQALADLHNLSVGTFFGSTRRDGTCSKTPIPEARQHVTAEMEDWLERGLRIDCLSSDELAIMRDASSLIPAFEGEQPLPCHRDYCPANWLVSDQGDWAGVIDFEFSGWDVRTADFSRYPNWEWISRPDLIEAFFSGYGRSFTAQEEQQRLFSLALYALGAVVWGNENDYHIFADEGRRALQHLRKLLDG